MIGVISLFQFLNQFKIWAWIVTSRAVVGSSAIKILGLHDIAMEITAR